MAIKAVILDIGGVLEINPRTGWQERWAKELGVTLVELDTRLAPILAGGSVGSITLDDVHDRIRGALGIDHLELTRLMADVWEEYLGTLNNELAAYFASLRPRIRTGILSNSFVGAREREQAAYGFSDISDVLVYSHEVGVMKPDPEIYLLACDRLGAVATETAFLDDVEVNVEAAASLGMHAIRFESTCQAIAALEAVLVGDPPG